MEIQFTTEVFRERDTFVAHTPELDISSCGDTESKALDNLKEAVRLFLEEADKIGTLNQILEEILNYSEKEQTEFVVSG